MSIYNMVNKVNPATFLILPLLGIGNPNDWPRFRDCFPTARHFQIVDDFPVMVPIDEKEKPVNIYVLLRVGGANRTAYAKQIAGLQSHPNYIRDMDDLLDSTYAHFVFSVPEEWKEDYKKATNADCELTSEKYQHLIRSAYPKLNKVLDALFRK